MATPEKISAKQAAIQLGTDARSLRKFLRSSSDFDAVGQGNRYEFDKAEMKKLKKLFNAKKVTGTDKEVAANTKHDLDINASVEEQDEIDATTEEVDLDDNSEPAEIEWDEDEEADLEAIEGPSDDDLEEIELTDDDL